MTNASAIGQKLWNYCNVLRDAGLSYGDYLEQRAFQGKLVPQDPCDEPASALLERIRADRAIRRGR